MLLERRIVSRKTPLDGKLEISAHAASQLALLGETFALRTSSGDGAARLEKMSCTCAKSASTGVHEHHFIESDLLRALEVDAEVRIELDDAQPGLLSIELAQPAR
ncbi:MAG: hypothetical protein H0U66_07325 [Gemmatimonadaceae bacterium]|nr:hypothetical protein [Gemmatimonadaceae bacterium]